MLSRRLMVSGALAGIQSYKTAVGICVAKLGVETGCTAGAHGIGADIAAGNAGATINYVNELSTADGVIIVETTGMNAAGDAEMILTLTPTVNANQAIKWVVTGTGCSDANGIDCATS